jgi:hypothetical protein
MKELGSEVNMKMKRKEGMFDGGNIKMWKEEKKYKNKKKVE